jgi:hypothetical protein
MNTHPDDRISAILARCCSGIPEADISRYRREYSAYAEDCAFGKFSGDFSDYATRYIRDPGMMIEIHTRMIRQNIRDEDRARKPGKGGYRI